MYASAQRPRTAMSIPGPKLDNPAAGTTGNPAPRPGMGDGRLTSDDLPVPMAVAGWALAGLGLVVLLRYGLRNGGVA